MNTAENTILDIEKLHGKVQDMYTDVAQNPHEEYHFEMGRVLAERLGYPAKLLDRVPQQAIESFAGVGYYFDLANIQSGECIVDLGSGSGMDSFIASLNVRPHGKVIGVDMTDAQRQKAVRLRDQHHFAGVHFVDAFIENVPCADQTADVVISNGVINLAADKHRVFKEISRILKPGGRMVISDIVTVQHLPQNISCDVDLWAACIGGAMQQEDYLNAIESADLSINYVRLNDEYEFLSNGAQWASDEFGVRSVSVLAYKK